MGASRAERLRAIDVPDLVDDGTSIRVRAEYAVGPRTPVTNQELAFAHNGTVVARAFSRDGTYELASGLCDSLAVARSEDPAGGRTVLS